jgi:hypothetical protein
MALSGTTYRVEQAGQAMIILTKVLVALMNHDKRMACSQSPQAAFFHIEARL